MSRRPCRAAGVLLATILLLVAGCGDPGDVAAPGSLAASVRLDGREYTVGGKEFAEQLVLCQITIAALESVGAVAEDECGEVGSDVVRARLLDGTIDMYWEYTGTGWTNHLGRRDPDNDPGRLYRAVREADRARGVAWLAPTPMSNSYAFAVNRADALRLNVQTVSDMARLAALGLPDGAICIEGEFARRPDGWTAMRDRYGLPRDPDKVQVVEQNAIYPEAGDGNPCTFGEVFATDPRIRSEGLVVLRDDLASLPQYNAALTVRQDVLAQDPRLARVVAPIAADLTEPVMTDLNAAVSVAGRDAREVARSWLRGRGYIG